MARSTERVDERGLAAALQDISQANLIRRDVHVLERDLQRLVLTNSVCWFIDPEAARIKQPAIEELNRRLRERRPGETRAVLEREIFGKARMPVTHVSMVADHIEHVRDVAGIDHVGLGGDFDGNEDWPEGLSDVSTYPTLLAELIHRGRSDRDIKKLSGGNILRALEQAENVAARLRRLNP